MSVTDVILSFKIADHGGHFSAFTYCYS